MIDYEAVISNVWWDGRRLNATYNDVSHLNVEKEQQLEEETVQYALKELEVHTKPLVKDSPAPYDEICMILNEVMEIAVKNGVNSISMPDEYVTVAAWLAAVGSEK